MLVVVSPAKRLDETPSDETRGGKPHFHQEADVLAGVARELSSQDLQKLMRISPALGDLNVERFSRFGHGKDLKPAIEMFAGDTYAGLDAGSLDEDALRYAQDHLCILSGLYGLLRPLDRIAPHRLEMGTRLANPRGKNLYDFWGDRIAVALNERAGQCQSQILVNCASVEYFSAVDASALRLRVVTPTFYEMRGGVPKIVSFFAKKARGSMARFIMQNRITDIEALTDFDLGGYSYQPEMSQDDNPVFLRDDEGH